MIAPILTFLSTRIVYVFVSVVVVVAAVPTIISIHGNTITVTPVASSSRHGGDDARTRLVIRLKAAGDGAIVKLNSEEAGCDSQIAQLASVSTLSSTATATAIERGKSEFHNDEQPFISEIKADEDEIAHMSVVTTTTVQAFLARIQDIERTALGEDGQHESTGSLLTACQTIIVEIRTIVVVVVQVPPPPPSGGDGEGDDIKPRI